MVLLGCRFSQVDNAKSHNVELWTNATLSFLDKVDATQVDSCRACVLSSGDSGDLHVEDLTQGSMGPPPFYLHLATTTPHAPPGHVTNFDPLVAYLDIRHRKVTLPKAPQGLQASRGTVRERLRLVGCCCCCCASCSLSRS